MIRKRRQKILGIHLLLLLACASINTAAQAADTVEVVMITSHGRIHIDLYTDKAPVTTANFLRYVDGEH